MPIIRFKSAGIIHDAPGPPTIGSSGVHSLNKALAAEYFPQLIQVCPEMGRSY